MCLPAVQEEAAEYGSLEVRELEVETERVGSVRDQKQTLDFAIRGQAVCLESVVRLSAGESITVIYR